MNIPVIRLEVQGMKHMIYAALTHETAAIDSGIKAALEKLCTGENVSRIVQEEDRRQIEAALKEEVQNFFRYSNSGRLAVREAVHQHLDRMYPQKNDG